MVTAIAGTSFKQGNPFQTSRINTTLYQPLGNGTAAAIAQSFMERPILTTRQFEC